MYGSVSALEHVHALGSVLPLGFGDVDFEDVGHDLPELVVLVLDEND